MTTKDIPDHNVCVTLGAHYLNDKVLELLGEWQNDCVGKYDVWLVYDNSRQDYQSSLVHEDTRTFLFDHQNLSDKYFMKSCSRHGKINPGNASFPIMEFYQHYPNYDYYWGIEYDVRFHGNWSDFFNYFSTNNSDLLTTTLFRYAFRPDWVWWKTVKTPWYVRNVDLIRGFLPVVRLSARALGLLSRKYSQNQSFMGRKFMKQWQGHDEVILPTMLHHYGMRIEDIGGEGEFVTQENRNRFYTNTPENDGLAPGTMVCPPILPEKTRVFNKLYHGVK